MSPKLQFGFAVVLAIFLVAHVIVQIGGLSYLTAMPLVFVLVGGLGILFWQWSNRPRREGYGRMHRKIAELNRLKPEEARKRAYALLENAEKFECRPASEPAELPTALADSLREFFLRFDSVRARAGEAEVSRESLGPAEYDDRFFRIGHDSDLTELVVRPGQDPVYEIDGADIDDEQLQAGSLTSIFHWVLVTDEVLHGRD